LLFTLLRYSILLIYEKNPEHFFPSAAILTCFKRYREA
jgi:hypothetical protein